MKLQKAFAAIEAHHADATSFLKEICSFEGTAADKAEIDRMADYVTAYAKGLGFCVARTPFEKCGDFLTIDLDPTAAPGGVMLAHMDTVHKKGAFGTPAVRIEGDRMIGPGVIDCKGGIAVALLAMQALRECGYSKNARLLLTSDEEISNVLGGEREQEFFRTGTAGFDYALNCETTEGNEVVVARRGIMRYEVTVKGKGGHAGIHYFECCNPVVEAAHKIIALESNSQKGGVTYSCNVIHAGSVSNVIPDECRFTVDVRLQTHAQMEKADRLVREIAQKRFLEGTCCEVKRLGKRPPMEKNAKSDALFDRLNNISQRVGLGPLVPVESGGGSDSAYTQAAGIVSLCGLGTCGEFCHTNREYAEIPSIAKRAKLLAALLLTDEGEEK